MEQSRGAPRAERVRGQASTIGVILVFAMVIGGAVTIVAFGASAIGDSQDRLSEQRAEKALTQFDSKAALVALGNTDIQQVSFGTDRQANFEVQNGTGWMMITIENQTSGTSKTLLNQSLGAITYEVNDNTLAYQGGGVWKQAANNSVMISPPEFHFRNGTLTLPVVNVTGAASLGNRASVRHQETIKKYPNATADDVNPLTNHRVTVTVQSDYYRGWGRYFEGRTDGEVEYDHDRKIANLTLVTPIRQRKVTAATASLAASGAFEIHGSARSRCSTDGDVQNGGSEMYTNSYNSSESGDYCDQATLGGYGHQGDIVYGKDVNISDGSGSSWIHGDVASGGNVTVSGSAGGGQPSVYGHINFTDSCNPSVSDCEDRVENSSSSVNEIDGIDTANSIDFHVENTIEEVNESGNPAGAPIDSDNRLEFDADSPNDEIELTSGKYLLDRIDFTANGGGDEIVLNTTDGNIVLAVQGDVTLPDDANISVEGDGHVLMYVGNESGHKTNSRWAFRMDKGSGVLNDGDVAEQFRLYGKNSMDARIGDGGGGGDTAKFVGVVYAPPGAAGNGTVKLNKGEVFGGVITGTTIITNSGGSIHYDEALKTQNVISRNAKILSVTYLHISTNRIHVD